MVDVTIKIGGQAGQGMQSISYNLGKLFSRGGYYVFVSQDIMSRIRGGHNFSQIRIKDFPVFSNSDKINVLIALNEETIDLHKDEMIQNGVIIYDGKTDRPQQKNLQYFSAPLEKLAIEYGKDKIMVNTVAIGVLMHLTGYPMELLDDIIKQEFKTKSEDIINRNLQCAKAGYNFAQKSFLSLCPCEIPVLKQKDKKILISGNEIIGLAAICSGLKFYAGYPMSPSTPIMEYIASKAKEMNIVLEQSEDEISAINMIIGASFAGVRSMTATSGGGFALMVEGLSLAGMTETPVVIVIAQRPGPATGFPTRTEQADLHFAINAGHGEFSRIILSLGNPEQAFYLTNKAFNLAEKYQIPAIILSDQHFSDSYWTLDKLDLDEIKIERFDDNSQWQNSKPYTYKRYELNETGISPRIFPGLKNQVVYADSDEHTEQGHITESAEIRNKMVQKRLKRFEVIRQELELLKLYPDNNAETILVCFGSTFGSVKEAVDIQRKQSKSIGMLHLSELYPFPKESVIKQLKVAKNIITVENNATGQLAKLIYAEIGIKTNAQILKFDGRSFCANEIIEKLEQLI